MAEKVDLGAATEDDVQHFVEHAFSVDFVFRSPHHQKGRQQKETTDVLAVYDDVAIPIEVKAQAYNADGSPREESAAWTKKTLEKAVGQVKGSVRMLRGTGTVRLQNVRRGELVFDPAKSHFFYGLIVLNHVSQPFSAEELVPEIAASDFPIHVLSFGDFFNLNRVLDTPADLVGYLEMRADVLVPTLKPRVHEEKRLIDYYFENLEALTEFRAKLRGEIVPAAKVKPYADTYRSIYRGDCPDIEHSYYVDRIIDRAHEIDDSSPSPFEDLAGAPKSDYAIIAEQLSHIVRPRRIYLGRMFRDAIERAGRRNEIEFATVSSKLRDECLLFMASPRPDTERAERNKDLRDYLLLLKAARQVTRGLGIATEAGFGRSRSYDFILVEEDPAVVVARSDYATIKELGDGLFGTATPR